MGFVDSIQKLTESFLGFKEKRSAILQQRNSLLKLLFVINIPNLIVLFLVNRIVKQAYMDQYFHYGQFSKYAQGNYQYWDPKITTPPGLYYIQRAFSFLIGNQLSTMRILNSLFFSNIFIVFVMKIYQFKDTSVNNISRALNLALTPTIYFFNFLDYTDSASIALITMVLYYNLIKSEYRSAIFSLLALYVRQNNVIWILYIILYRILTDYKKQMFAPKPFFSHIFSIIRVTFNNKIQIIKDLKLQFLILALFIGYLKIYNEGSFVFGDRQNHQMSFHPVQILYLALFIVINAPITLDQYFTTFKQMFQKLFFSRHFLASYLFLLSLSIILVQKFTKVHPFILADNRHFTFYIYRYANKIWIIKWLACLLYPICILFLFRIVVNSEQKLFKFILFMGASFGYLTFGELVEFRYFAIPFLVYSIEIENKNIFIDVQRVHKNQSPITQKQRMIWTTSIKIIINIVVFGLFLGWQFNNQFGKGRIMW